MATPVTKILTSLHGKEIGLNYERKLVVPAGYVIEGTPGSMLQFDENGFAQEIEPAFAQLSDTTDQVPETTDPFQVQFNTTDEVENVTVASSTITIESDGVYSLIVGGQISKATGSNLRFLDMWVKKNGTDVPRSSVRNSLTTDDTTVLVVQLVSRLAVGDTLKVYAEVDSTDGGLGLYTFTPATGPTTPSVILSLFKVR